MKKVLAGCLLAVAGAAHGEPTAPEKGLSFETVAAGITDKYGVLSECGLGITVLRAEPNKPGMRFAIKITSSSQKEYVVRSAFQERGANSPNWVRPANYLQWIRIGDAQPIRVNPLNVRVARGEQSFVTDPDPSGEVYAQLSKQSIPVSANFSRDNDVIYSGELKVSAKTRAQIDRCFKDLR